MVGAFRLLRHMLGETVPFALSVPELSMRQRHLYSDAACEMRSLMAARDTFGEVDDCCANIYPFSRPHLWLSVGTNVDNPVTAAAFVVARWGTILTNRTSRAAFFGCHLALMFITWSPRPLFGWLSFWSV